jgi:hypothetical protein
MREGDPDLVDFDFDLDLDLDPDFAARASAAR